MPFKSLRVDGSHVRVAVTVLRENGRLSGDASSAAAVRGCRNGDDEIDQSHLHIASQCSGPSLLFEDEAGGAGNFEELYRRCVERNASIKLDLKDLAIEGAPAELHLVPSLARRGGDKFVHVFFGYVIPSSTLRRVVKRIMAVGADLDETLVHSFLRDIGTVTGDAPRGDGAFSVPLDYRGRGVSTRGSDREEYVMWIRSRVSYFLRHVLEDQADVFDLHVVSAGMRDYVLSACRAIAQHVEGNPRVPEDRVLSERGPERSKLKCLYEMLGEQPPMSAAADGSCLLVPPVMATAVDDIPAAWTLASIRAIIQVKPWCTFEHGHPAVPPDEIGLNYLARVVQRLDAEYVRQCAMLDVELQRWNTVFRRMGTADGANLDKLASLVPPRAGMPVCDYLQSYYNQAAGASAVVGYAAAAAAAAAAVADTSNTATVDPTTVDATAGANDEWTSQPHEDQTGPLYRMVVQLLDDVTQLKSRVGEPVHPSGTTPVVAATNRKKRPYSATLRFASRPRGLPNSGVDCCYLAVFQVFAVLVRRGRLCIAWPELERVVGDIWRGVDDDDEGGGGVPDPSGALREMRGALRSLSEVQEDVHELLVRAIERGVESTHGAAFAGKKNVSRECLGCGQRIEDPDPSYTLLTLDIDVDVESAMRSVVEIDRFKCECCGVTDGVASETTRAPTHAGNVLAIHVARFPYVGVKDRRFMAFSEFMTLHDQTYKLVATIDHDGESIDRGHYIAHVRSGKAWFRCSDDIVTEVDIELVLRGHHEDDVRSEAAYVIVYERVPTSPAATGHKPTGRASSASVRDVPPDININSSMPDMKRPRVPKKTLPCLACGKEGVPCPSEIMRHCKTRSDPGHAALYADAEKLHRGRKERQAKSKADTGGGSFGDDIARHEQY